jgi:hypothetical protein
MKEFFETINEYPWTTFFVFIMILTIVGALPNINNRK